MIDLNTPLNALTVGDLLSILHPEEVKTVHSIAALARELGISTATAFRYKRKGVFGDGIKEFITGKRCDCDVETCRQRIYNINIKNKR
ncbi:MAG: hypothetical protein IJS19_06385 [Muribaculaceae bacterium]|nr:hypothetical protein [Muribaculaceae bacterium]